MDIFGIHLNAKHIMWSIIILQCLCFLFLFFFVKREFHSDEVWTFGLANSKESPHIFMDIDRNPINMREWKSAEIFKDYLTVGEDERFDFSIPYRNSIKDTPPLLLFYIHFISSIFPGHFSFAYLIPLVLFSIIISGYCFYNSLVYGGLSEKTALLTMFLFGLSAGGIDIFIFLRHYSLFVTECLVLLYLHMRIYKYNLLSVKTCIGIIVCNVAGVMTHNYYWVYAFILGCYFVLYLLIKRKWKQLLIYSFSMLAGVGIGYMIYPSLFSSYEMWEDNVFGKGFSYTIQVIVCIRLILMQLIGIGPSIYSKGILPTIGLCIIYLCIVSLPLIILLARNGKLRPIIRKIADWVVAYKNKFVQNMKKSIFLFGICLIEVVTIILVVAKTINIYGMLLTTNRYLFYAYPLAAIIIVIIINSLFVGIHDNKKRKIITISLIILGMVLSHVRMSCVYAGNELKSGTTVDKINNSNIIIVLNNDWELTIFTHVINSDNNIIALKSTELEKYKDIIEQADKSKPTYLILENSAYYNEDIVEDEDDPLTQNIFKYSYSKTKLPTLKDIEEYFTKLKCCDTFEMIGQEVMINLGYSLYKVAD